MEPLKLFATYETDFDLATQAKHLCAQGWQASPREQSLSCRCAGISILLEDSGDGLFLLRGECDSGDKLPALQDFLRDNARHFQLDIFEEDGRLIRRFSSLDASE